MTEDFTYNYTPPDGENTRHIWSLKGSNGAVHVWASEYSPDMIERLGERFYGGVEIHSPVQLYEHDPNPSNDHCWLLDGPCWHDGSSLYFSDRIAPWLSDAPFSEDTHKHIIRILYSYYMNHFGGGGEDLLTFALETK